MKDLAKIDNNTAAVTVEFFGDTVEEFIGAKVSRKPTTRKTYRHVLTTLHKFFIAHKIVAPTKNDVNDFFRSLTSKASATQKLFVTVTKNYFDWLSREGKYANVAADLTLDLSKNKTHSKRALTAEQAQTLLASVTGDTIIARRDKAILALALTTGVRCCEISRADVEDLSPDGCGGYFLQVQGKGHVAKDQTVRVPAPVADLINAYLSVRGEVKKETKQLGNKAIEVTPLFASMSRQNRGVRLSVQSVGKTIARHMKAAGVHMPHIVTAHSCRHFAAQTAIEGGIDLREVSSMLRHSAITTTMIYLEDIAVKKRRAELCVAATLFGGAA